MFSLARTQYKLNDFYFASKIHCCRSFLLSLKIYQICKFIRQYGALLLIFIISFKILAQEKNALNYQIRLLGEKPFSNVFSLDCRHGIKLLAIFNLVLRSSIF